MRWHHRWQEPWWHHRWQECLWPLVLTGFQLTLIKNWNERSNCASKMHTTSSPPEFFMYWPWGLMLTWCRVFLCPPAGRWLSVMELKVWVEGVVRVVCGLSIDTSCQDVVIALAQATGEFLHIQHAHTLIKHTLPFPFRTMANFSIRAPRRIRRPWNIYLTVCGAC